MHAVLDAAAIFIAALVGQRRDKAGQQIAVRHVHFDEIEAGFLSSSVLRTKSARTASIIARSMPADVDCAENGAGRWRDDRPGFRRGQRLAVALPQQAGRGFAAGVTELHADLGAAVTMDEVDDAAPGWRMLGLVESGAAGVMRPSRLTSVISAMTSPAPPIARLPRCTMPVIDRAILRQY